ncbi:RDD family protein [Halopseudomonas oceani]|uniref:RDD domain-containing protein n=1 Tax=Halopseudomonas oceani TaxID=1708783 RepID=A0A2P4F0J6_9GAMM|nr:RDD family protein [Halopseudomonas oceani]POB06525.1 hypothetical protein C1949_01955 [Halopseudomonas oceani]
MALSSPSIGRRVAARFLDMLVALLLVLCTNVAFIGHQQADAISMLTLLLFILYLLFGEGLTGQSIGKKIMGIAVISTKTGMRAHPLQSLGRNFFIYFFFPIGFLIELISLLMSGPRIGDLIANTRVVDLRHTGHNNEPAISPLTPDLERDSSSATNAWIATSKANTSQLKGQESQGGEHDNTAGRT